MPSDDVATLTLRPIGVVRCAQATKVEAARQPTVTDGAAGVIELEAGRHFEHALEDIASWERLWILYWFHHNAGWRPKVLPPRSVDGRKGVFATRSPHRPNPLGLSAVRLERVDGLRLYVRDVDMLDGTPVLDIKPYVAYADAFPGAHQGWLQTPCDPVPAHTVSIAPRAEQQLAWVAARTALPLRERIVAALSLGAEPAPYRRIRRLDPQHLLLAVQDWRVLFSVDGRQVQVLEIRSGYRASQLQGSASAPSGPIDLHRAFVREHSMDGAN
jgi:tRNA-Thr(GGU) m(6)t(6)A37 methyltransferase TsaA